MNEEFFDNYDFDNGKNTNLPDALYEHLPHPLNECCTCTKDIAERNLLLLSSLTMLSGMLPNVQGNYAGQKVSPNLYLFVAGRYGSGKGKMLLAKSLANEAGRGLFVPLTTTRNQALKILHHNNSRGILFETEGDTLERILKRDSGELSGLLRKAFHHEPVDYTASTYDKETLTIEQPCLSVLLSGTFDQLFRLVPDTENGLFSRFCYYLTEDSVEFKNPFDETDINLDAIFNKAGQYCSKLYQLLLQRKQPVIFTMEKEEQEHFFGMMAEAKKTISEMQGENMEGAVNRLGLIVYRIAMTLTALRAYEQGELADTITCTYEDLFIAQLVTTMTFHYTLKVLDTMEDRKEAETKQRHSSVSDEQGKDIVRLYNCGYSLRDISFQVFNTVNKYTTVQRYLKNTMPGY